MGKSYQLPVRFDQEDKERLDRYLAATYKGSKAEFLRRLAMEKVSAWETFQREEIRKEEEHQAKLAQLKSAS